MEQHLLFIEMENKIRLSLVGSEMCIRDSNCAMSQVRLWKVARTESEIVNNMYFEVNPKNPNLIALWPMDEGDGTSFRDATGNGHDATSNGALQKWEHNIRFDK
mgnify:CR=1 FL=1